MSEMRVNSASPGNMRLDLCVSRACLITRSQASRLIRDGRVTVQGDLAQKAGFVPPEGAAVSVTLPAVQDGRAKAEDLPLDILYQDEDIAVVTKPAGMVTHPAAGHPEHTLVNALMYHLTQLSGIGGEKRPGIVHRLDKDTSGLLLVAKHDAAHLALSGQLAGRTMEKHYRTVVEGEMKDTAGLIDSPIMRSRTDRKRMATDPAGRASQTEWTLLENLGHAAYLDVSLLTGRTHQIRVHMASVHHPVIGDALYGHPKRLRAQRLMLHAYSIGFNHPVTGERMMFVHEPPEDFLGALGNLRIKTAGQGG